MNIARRLSLAAGATLAVGLATGCGAFGASGPLGTVHMGAVSKTATAIGSVSTGPSAMVQFDTPDAAIVKPGLTARLSFAGVPGLNLSGTVSQVNVQHSAIAQKTIYHVAILISGDDPRLKPGDWVKASIDTLSVPNVLVVPNAAVRSESAESYVITADGKHEVFTPGAVGDDVTEVRAGLTDGMQVRMKQ